MYLRIRICMHHLLSRLFGHYFIGTCTTVDSSFPFHSLASCLTTCMQFLEGLGHTAAAAAARRRRKSDVEWIANYTHVTTFNNNRLSNQ